MRLTCSLLLTIAVVVVPAHQVSAQQKEGLLQRLGNYFNKKKNDSAKSDLMRAEPRPATLPQQLPAPKSNYEARGVIVVDEGSTAPAKPLPSGPLPKSPTALPPGSATPGKAPNATPTLPPAATRPATPGIPTSGPVAGPMRPLPAGAKTVTAQPTALPKVPAANDPLAQRLARQISQACPQARNVKVVFGTGSDLTVEMDVRSMEECNALAGAVFAIRDLDAYKVNLKFNVPQ